MAKPLFSNCVRIQLDFILEFEKNAHLPRAFSDDIYRFLKAGVMACIPKDTIPEKYGDIHIVLGPGTVMTLMRPQDLERKRAEYIRVLREEMNIPEPALSELVALAEKVGRRDASEGQGVEGRAKEEGAEAVERGVPRRGKEGGRARRGPTTRARGEVPGVRKAVRRGK